MADRWPTHGKFGTDVSPNSPEALREIVDEWPVALHNLPLSLMQDRIDTARVVLERDE